MINHHPDEALLLDYATGALSEAVALTIATHASMCIRCMRQINQLEAIGGSLLASETPAECDDGVLAQILMRLDDEGLEPAATVKTESSAILPPPLRPYVNEPLHQLPGSVSVGCTRSTDCRLRTPRFAPPCFGLQPAPTRRSIRIAVRNSSWC